jgi:hypothetical protein
MVEIGNDSISKLAHERALIHKEKLEILTYKPHPKDRSLLEIQIDRCQRLITLGKRSIQIAKELIAWLSQHTPDSDELVLLTVELRLEKAEHKAYEAALEFQLGENTKTNATIATQNYKTWQKIRSIVVSDYQNKKNPDRLAKK